MATWFGTHAATFDTLEATMSGAISDGIRVHCSDGASSYIVQITGSSNPAPSNTPYGTVTANAHYMALTTDSTQAVSIPCITTPALPPLSPMGPT